MALGDETPAKKKHKRSSSSVEDADARLAAELQAQENRLARARTTRGGGVAAKPRKKVTKKKSAAKVKGEDSDVDHSDASGNKEKRKAGGGFQKPFNLSYQLGELVGCTQVRKMSRESGGDAFVMLTQPALTPAGGEEAVGTYQVQRAARPERPTANMLRRKDAGRVQAAKGRHVPDE